MLAKKTRTQTLAKRILPFMAGVLLIIPSQYVWGFGPVIVLSAIFGILFVASLILIVVTNLALSKQGYKPHPNAITVLFFFLAFTTFLLILIMARPIGDDSLIIGSYLLAVIVGGSCLLYWVG